MSEMRILTVRQPWAWALIHGGKDVENRVRNIAGDYRGPVAIHAALGVGTPDEFNANTYRVARLGPPVPFGLTLGAVIGVVDLVDVHVGPEFGGGCHKLNSPLPVTPTYDLCSPWGDSGAYHLVLANPRPLTAPIPFKGALGLRKLDADTTAAVLAAIA